MTDNNTLSGALRELVAKWREAGKEAMRAGHRSGNPEYGEICRSEADALRVCADELEAALAAQPEVGGERNAAMIEMLQASRDEIAEFASRPHLVTAQNLGGWRRVMDSAIAVLAQNATGWIAAAPTPAAVGQGEAVANLIECARELRDLMEQVREGNYAPDSFTVQPIDVVLANFTHPAAVREVDDAEALAHFTEYFVRNYPGPDTVIHKPEWHAPKIFRAAQHALKAAALARDGVEGGA